MSEPVSPARFDHEVLRSAFAFFPSGVTAVCAIRNNEFVGMAASSFTSVSLQPPLVSVCIARTSTTWPILRAGDRLGVSVLADDQHQLARQFASRGVDRFAGVRVTTTKSRAVFVDHSCLWLECTLYSELPAGDHEIALLEVQDIRTFPERLPLVFHSSEFRQLLFPST
ncbi:MAG: flavin reductase family protein [Actinomycetota bacterium]|nr:flavin reductase family protein [Actinomycetota bacterium]